MIRRPNQPSFGGEFDVEPRRRLLFATLPDLGAKARLARLTERLRHDGTMLSRPVDPDRWHITLNLLGDFGDQMPRDLAPTACAAAETVKAPPFEVTFDCVIRNESRVLLWSSAETSELKSFRQALIEAMIGAGLRRHVNSAFNPHVTLAYGVNDPLRMSIEPIRWTVRDFVLIESLLGKHQHVERGRWDMI